MTRLWSGNQPARLRPGECIIILICYFWELRVKILNYYFKRKDEKTKIKVGDRLDDGGNESSFISFYRVFFNKYIQFEMKHSTATAATAPAPIMKQKAHISQGGGKRKRKKRYTNIFNDSRRAERRDRMKWATTTSTYLICFRMEWNESIKIQLQLFLFFFFRPNSQLWGSERRGTIL